MSKILLVGMGPLLEKGIRHFGGQCLRTWCFFEPLLEDGHQMLLVTLPIYDPNNPDMHQAGLSRRKSDGFEHLAFRNLDTAFIHQGLSEIARSFAPDAIFAINTTPAWFAAQIPLCAPMWADLFGYEMTEKQGRAARTGDAAALLRAWKTEAMIARRADKFSTVSRPQLHALLGEIASVGRLNRHTFHYHFAHHVPTAWHPAFTGREIAEPDGGQPVLRGAIVPENAFVMLWSGGYNFWTDPDVLFDFLETVLAANERVHYVSTGGAIEGYDHHTYAAFENRVRESRFRDRFHLLGWVPAEQLPRIYQEADLGLNIDSENYETLFGARNRINNMMAAGLPVLTTFGSEISAMIAEADCGIVGRSLRDLAEAAAALVHAPERLRDLAERSRSFALEAFSPRRLTEPARDWAREPRLAPDNAEKRRTFPALQGFLDVSLNAVEETARIVESTDVPAMRRAQAELQRLRLKPWYRCLRFIKKCAARKPVPDNKT